MWADAIAGTAASMANPAAAASILVRFVARLRFSAAYCARTNRRYECHIVFA